MTMQNATKPVPAIGETPFIKDRSKPRFKPVTGAWIPFSERFPDPRPAIDDPTVMVRAHVMVTNNINAVDRCGRPSHVWWLCPQVAESSNKRYKKGEVIGLDEGDQFVVGLTHWFDPFAPVQEVVEVLPCDQ